MKPARLRHASQISNLEMSAIQLLRPVVQKWDAKYISIFVLQKCIIQLNQVFQCFAFCIFSVLFLFSALQLAAAILTCNNSNQPTLSLAPGGWIIGVQQRRRSSLQRRYMLFRPQCCAMGDIQLIILMPGNVPPAPRSHHPLCREPVCFGLHLGKSSGGVA